MAAFNMFHSVPEGFLVFCEVCSDLFNMREVVFLFFLIILTVSSDSSLSLAVKH